MSIIRKVNDSICAVAYAYCKDEPSEKVVNGHRVWYKYE